MFLYLKVNCRNCWFEMRPSLFQGKLKVHEHVVNGFDKMAETFVQQMRGEFTGKVVVKI